MTLTFLLLVAVIPDEDRPEPSYAGGVEEWGDLQRSPDILRQLDEYQLEGCHLYFQGKYGRLN